MISSPPVALLIFNRPQQTKAVFEAIRQAQPKTLLIVADGARSDRPHEAEQCAVAQAIVDDVDWDCEVLKNISEVNLGCKHRVSSGLDWVFSQVEAAIILEDDCLPTPSFFPYCAALLDRYRDEPKIMHISGDNFQPCQRTRYSYYFSRYTHIWGWATWQRAWQNYDVAMTNWPEIRNSGLLNSLCDDPLEAAYWARLFDQVAAGLIDTWDYQWLYHCWLNNGLAILPEVNLISNIGFGEGATHTHAADSPMANLPTTDLWEIEHPKFIVRSQVADRYSFDQVFGGAAMRQMQLLQSQDLS